MKKYIFLKKKSFLCRREGEVLPAFAIQFPSHPPIPSPPFPSPSIQHIKVTRLNFFLENPLIIFLSNALRRILF